MPTVKYKRHPACRNGSDGYLGRMDTWPLSFPGVFFLGVSFLFFFLFFFLRSKSEIRLLLLV